jgi:hypothetical protein
MRCGRFSMNWRRTLGIGSGNTKSLQRQYRFLCATRIWDGIQWQMPLPYPSQSPYEIAQSGYALFREHYWWPKPVRALTIRGINPGREVTQCRRTSLTIMLLGISAGDWTTRLTNSGSGMATESFIQLACTGNCRSPRIAARQYRCPARCTNENVVYNR